MPATVYDAVFGSDTLRQISQSNLNPNMSIMKEKFSGNAYIAEQFIESAEYAVDLTTTDIYGALGIFRSDSAESIRIANGGTVIVPWNGRTSGGTFLSATTSHVRIKGYSSTSPVQLVPMSISAPTSGFASFQGSVHFLSRNGLEAPILVQTAQTLASQAFLGSYRLGPLNVNGTLIAEQIGWNLNFGVTLSEKKRYGGAPYPTDCFIVSVEPTIEFTAEAMAFLSTITGGLPISSLSAYLRKCDEGATVVADATETNIEFSFAGGLATHNGTSASGSGDAQNTVIVAGEALVIDRTAAIV